MNHTDVQTANSKMKHWGLIIILCVIAIILLAIGIFLYLRPAQPQPTPDRQALNGPQQLLPALDEAQELIRTYADTVDADQIQGESFHYNMAEQSEALYSSDLSTYFNADIKISPTAYFDTELQILYLDYAVNSADCMTYLSLDAQQAGKALPMTGLIAAGNGIHQISWQQNQAPDYITVMGVICIDSAYYYFAQLHQQELSVISGTTLELANMGIGDVSLIDPEDAPFVALDGIWIAASQPVIADDEDHSYFSDGGYYTFTPDGSFTFQPLKLGKQGTWYHMEGGEGTYEGTYHYTGSVIILNYRILNETYFDETAGYELTRPVEIDKTEQFTLQINQSCASMCAVIPDHPQFGETLIFERAKSDDPIHALLVAINSLP